MHPIIITPLPSISPLSKLFHRRCLPCNWDRVLTSKIILQRRRPCPVQIIIIPIRSCKTREALTNSSQHRCRQAPVSSTIPVAALLARASSPRTTLTYHLKAAASTLNKPQLRSTQLTMRKSLLVQVSSIVINLHPLMHSRTLELRQRYFSSRNSQQLPFSRVTAWQQMTRCQSSKKIRWRRTLSLGRNLTSAHAWKSESCPR